MKCTSFSLNFYSIYLQCTPQLWSNQEIRGGGVELCDLNATLGCFLCCSEWRAVTNGVICCCECYGFVGDAVFGRLLFTCGIVCCRGDEEFMRGLDVGCAELSLVKS